MSALIERLKDVQKKSKITVDQWVASLTDEERAAWFDAVLNPAITNADLMRVAKEENENVAVGKDSMREYRISHGLSR